jgi:hypothetical protein
MDSSELWAILSQAVASVARKHQGDPAYQSQCQYPVWHVLKLLLWCTVRDIAPWVLYERMERDPEFRRRLGLPTQLISLSQYKKRLQSPLLRRALLDFLQWSGARALRVLGHQEVRIVAMDLTSLESSRRRDAKASWGWDSRGGFWGYKLGLICSQQGVILGLTLMRANFTEYRVNTRLIRMARETIQTAFGATPVEYLVCDAGFDGERTYQAAHQLLDAPAVCPPKRRRSAKAKSAGKILSRAKCQTPFRYQDHQLWETQEATEVYRKRTVIEQINGQLKEAPFRIDEIPPRQRGVRRLLLRCLAKAIYFNLTIIINICSGRKARQIKGLAA